MKRERRCEDAPAFLAKQRASYEADAQGQAVAERKSFLLRIDREVIEAIQRWANDDLRSLNGQIEFLLRRTLRESGRARKEENQEKES